MSFDQLVDEIKKLSHEEQVQLVDRLVENLAEHSDPEMDREHIEIIAERMRHATTFVPGDEVLRRIRERLPQ